MRQQIVFGLFLIAFSLLKVEFQAQTLPSYLPSNGLVGWWPFNGNANDESGNGNHGTVNGATLTADRNGNINEAYNFNGLNNRIAIGNVLQSIGQPSSAASINLWFKTDVTYISGPSNLDPVGTIISDYKRQGSCCEFNYLVSLSLAENPHRIVWNQRGAGTDYNLTKNTNYIDNDWHNIVLIIDGAGNQKVYIDGLLAINGIYDAYANYADQTSPWEPDWQIGASHWNDGSNSFDYINYFKGIVDDVAIWNRALTPSEITALYNGTIDVSGCANANACNYNASATLDDGSCTFPAQTYLNCDGTCINDTDNDGVCNELEVALPTNVPSNGLVAWYPFNGNANDESGNGNHGTVNGATLSADRGGNGNSAYLFNGSTSYIQCLSSGPGGTSPVSVSLWVNSSDPGVSAQLIGWGQSQNTPGTEFRILTDHVITACGHSIAFDSFMSARCFGTDFTGSWQNFVLVYDPSSGNSVVNSKIYLNGVLLSECFLDASYEVSVIPQFPICIGKDHGYNGAFYSGTIDDIAIYNRALTQEEITALYTGTSSNNNSGGGSGSTAGTPAESVPAGIPYQAVIRDNTGAALANTPVTVRFTLHENTTSGSTEYQETQSLTTNTLGLINTQFGAGTATQGTFAGINWSNTTKFIQVEANTGAGYVDMGTQQMMSVPFAIQANKATAIKNAGLPVYADNAAALAGGLVAGEMYRTANGDLKIVF